MRSFPRESLVTPEFWFPTLGGSLFFLENGRLKRQFSSLDEVFQIKPRPYGMLHFSLEVQCPKVITTPLLRQSHPEAPKRIKSIVVIPFADKKQRQVLTLQSPQPLESSPAILKKVQDQATSMAAAWSNFAKAVTYHRIIEQYKTNLQIAQHELNNALTSLQAFATLDSVVMRYSTKELYI